jgi:hypothetical protein
VPHRAHAVCCPASHPPTRSRCVGGWQRLHFFNNTAYNVADMTYSLNAIEHGVLRGNQKPPGSYCREFRPKDRRLQAAVVVWDPRIHFALVRGTSACPRLQVRCDKNKAVLCPSVGDPSSHVPPIGRTPWGSGWGATHHRSQ